MTNVVICENIKHMPIYKSVAYRIDPAEGDILSGIQRFYSHRDRQAALKVLRNVTPRPKLVKLYEHQSLHDWAEDELFGFLEKVANEPTRVFMLSDSLLPENGRMVLELDDLHLSTTSGISAKIVIEGKGGVIPVWTIPYEKDNVGFYHNPKGHLKLPLINRGGRIAWQLTKEQVKDHLGLDKESGEVWDKVWRVVNRIMLANLNYDEAYYVRTRTSAFFQGGSRGPEEGFILLEFAGVAGAGDFLDYLGKELADLLPRS